MKIIYAAVISCALFTSSFYAGGISSEDLYELEKGMAPFDYRIIKVIKNFFKKKDYINPEGYIIHLSINDMTWIFKDFTGEEEQLLFTILGDETHYCPSLWAPQGITYIYTAHPTNKNLELFKKFITKFNENHPDKHIVL